MIKKIKVFIASSIEELKLERVEIGDFFRQINDIYIDRGIHFSLIKCEDCDKAIALEGKQAEYDAMLRDSDLSFFIFFKNVGEYTKHEFEVAVESFRETYKPKIITYFKYVESPDEVSAEVKSFMNMLDTELKHYYSLYGNIDTLKFGIVMQLLNMQLDSPKLEIEDGSIKLGGNVIAGRDNISMFGGNKSLGALTKELEEVNGKYYDLRSKCVEDTSLYEEYLSVSAQKSKIEKNIRKIEEDTLSIANDMYSDTSFGKLTPRQAEGYRLLEKGDLEGAIRVLDYDEIKLELEHNKKLVDNLKERLQGNVGELIQRTKLLLLQGYTRKIASECEKLYKEASELEEEYHLSTRKATHYYASLLYSERKISEAAACIERLDKYYDLYPPTGDDKTEFLSLKGIIYTNAGRFDEAEKAYKAEEAELRRIYENSGTSENKAKLGTCFINQSSLYNSTNNREKALEVCGYAYSIFNSLKDEGDYLYKHRYVSSCVNISALYILKGDKNTAVEFLKAGIAVCESIEDKRMLGIYELQANLCMHLSLCINKEADSKYGYDVAMKAVTCYELLSVMNSRAYSFDLCKAYMNVMTFVSDNAKRLDYMVKARNIMEKLYQKEPDVYAYHMALAYCNIGIVYTDIPKYGAAEDAFKRAISVCKKRAGDDSMKLHLANSYYGLGNVYAKKENYTELKNAFNKALPLFGELAKKNPKAHEARCNEIKNVLARLQNMGNNQPAKNNKTPQSGKQKCEAGDNLRLKADKLYNKGATAEALDAYQKALTEYTKMPQYDDANIGYCCTRVALIYTYYVQNSESAERHYKMSVSIYEKLAKENPDKYEYQLASVYFFYGKYLCNNKRDYTNAYMTTVKAYFIYDKLYKKNSKKYEVDLATVYTELGKTRVNMRDYANAEIELGKAMQLYDTMTTPLTGSYIDSKILCYNTAGYLYANMKQPAKALTVQKKSFAILARETIKDPRTYIGSFRDLTEIITGLVKQVSSLTEAKQQYVEILRVYDAVLPKFADGVLDEDVYICCKSLAEICRGLRNTDEAKKYSDRAYGLCVKLAKTKPQYQTELSKFR